jgi:hypothetical protein
MIGSTVDKFKYAGCPTLANTISVSIGASATNVGSALTTHSMYRLCSTVDCYFTFQTYGIAAAATTAGPFLKAGTPETFSTEKLNGLSVIQSSGGGTLSVTYLGTF